MAKGKFRLFTAGPLALLLLIPIGFGLAMLFGVGAGLLEFGQRTFLPGDYWAREVSRIESRIATLSRDLDACKLKVAKGELELAESFRSRGDNSQGAIDLLTLARQSMQKSCDSIVISMLLEAPKLATAKAELRKY